MRAPPRYPVVRVALASQRDPHRPDVLADLQVGDTDSRVRAMVRTTGFVTFPVRITSVIRTLACLAAPLTRTTRYRLPPLKTSRADVSLRAAAFAVGFCGRRRNCGHRVAGEAHDRGGRGRRGWWCCAGAGRRRSPEPGVGVGIGVPPSVGATHVGPSVGSVVPLPANRRQRTRWTPKPPLRVADVLGIHVDETRLRALDLDAGLTECVRRDDDLVLGRPTRRSDRSCCSRRSSSAAGMIRPRGSARERHRGARRRGCRGCRG